MKRFAVRLQRNSRAPGIVTGPAANLRQAGSQQPLRRSWVTTLLCVHGKDLIEFHPDTGHIYLGLASAVSCC